MSAIERGLRDEPTSESSSSRCRASTPTRSSSGGQTARFARLYEASGGNPFYLLELARMEPDGGDASTPTGALGVPAAVAAATVEELEGLSRPGAGLPRARQWRATPSSSASRLPRAGMSEPDALDALDELIARELVRATHVPRRFRFRHPLVRRAVYESSPAGTRIAAHGRSAEALEARGAPVAARAHHVEHSAQHGRRRGCCAPQRGRRGRGEAGAREVPRAGSPPPSPCCPRRRHAGARQPADGARGITVGDRALRGKPRGPPRSIELTASDEPDLRVRLIGACATVEQLLGHHEEARERLTRRSASLADSSSPQAVELMIHLAGGDFYRMDYEGMRNWGERALVVAEPLDQALAGGQPGRARRRRRFHRARL